MLENEKELKEFKKKLDDQRLLHQRAKLPRQSRCIPIRPLRKDYADTSKRTVELAAKLGVPVVIDFSGCPGDSDNAKYPELGHVPLAAGIPGRPRLAMGKESDAVLDRARQVRQRSWRENRDRDAPRFVVYSPETMLKLRSIAGDSVGCNYDPSHMFWQSIDPIKAVRVLGDSIFHVHAKDTQIYDSNLPKTGVLDTKKYTDEKNRAWIFRTCGYGHPYGWWKEFISTLRMYGYDYVLSIEHEDSLMSPDEGLTKAAEFLNQIIIREQPAAAWWV